MGEQLGGGGPLRVSGGFLLLLAVLFWLDEGVGLLLPALAAGVLHELGHLLAVKAAGGGVKYISLTAIGAEMALDESRPLSYGREGVAALAGPAASLLCAWLAAGLGWFLLAGMCLGQGLFNLLPLPPLDGGRALWAFLAARGWERGGERVWTAAAGLLLGGLVGAGAILLNRFGNPTLLLTAGWLLFGTLARRRRGGRP